MKTLQSNFTTPEQSKRLLELGVPADSADCYYTWKLDSATKINVLDNETYSELLDHISQFTVPCWSVGRLIEIYEICFGGYFGYRYFRHTLMEDVLLKIEEQIDIIDFSKLEG